jgi:RND family efflux transporter MFP subunit
VTAVFADLGDTVSSGQTLLRYDTDLLEGRVRTAEAVLKQAAGEAARKEDYRRRLRAVHEKQPLTRIELDEAESQWEEAVVQRAKAEEQLLRTKAELRAATVTSPVSGVVLERFVEIGETPRRNQHLFTIGQLDQVRVEARLSEDRLRELRLHQKASVAFDAYPNELFEGELVRIQPGADSSTRTVTVFVEIDNADGRLKAGLTGFVRMRRELTGILVPSIAIIDPTGRASTVFVVGGGNASLRRIEIGSSAEGKTEILSGLEVGEHVVVVGQHYLRDGDSVRIGE